MSLLHEAIIADKYGLRLTVEQLGQAFNLAPNTIHNCICRGDAMKQGLDFKFIEFNPRRAMRGADAARVEVTDAGGEPEWMWMNKRDLSKNIKLFGEHPELLKAKSAYGAFP